MSKSASVPGFVGGDQSETAELGAHAATRESAVYVRVKRVFDLLVCISASPAVLMIIAFLTPLILLFMGPPIFFCQPRVGLNGRTFRMFKLRTMVNTSSTARPSGATIVGDPRVTRLGRLLRRSHLDELPQLWNILNGEMTLIGPRPEQPHLVKNYIKLLPNYELRHSVRPGLSGWAQVRYGYAADVNETGVKLRYDLYYVKNFGIALDIKIALLTVLVFMNRRYVR